MVHSYLDTLVTPSVAAAQERLGSRPAQERHVRTAEVPPALGPDETDFVTGRDWFVLATVGETGWPYVQHRGGPAGFLRVLDEGRTLAWADLRGNRQYLSVGNLTAHPRVSLLLLDQARRARLKVIGEATLHEDPDEALLERVRLPDQPGRVERVVTVAVRGFDWNCPQHITPRWSAEELAPVLAERFAGLEAEVAALRAENARLRATAAPA